MFYLIVLIVLHGFAEAQKCTIKSSADNVICKDLHSLAELSNEMSSTWKHVQVVNSIGSYFLIAEHEAKHLNVIESLDLSQSGQIQITDHGFTDLPNLKSLNLSAVQLENFKIGYFPSQSLLQDLDASYNKLTTLNRNSLALYNLRSFNLSHNNISAVDENIFKDFGRLQTLNLDHNHLKSPLLSDVPSLEYLSINNNLIEVLPSNGFRKMSQLEVLSISSNPLRKIEDQAFQGLSNLKILNLSHNSIDSLTPNVFLGFNRYKIIHLDLSYNNITGISGEPFKHLNKLQFLNLSGNSIRSLDSRSFEGLTSLRRLYLIENNIATIGESTFVPLVSLDALYLDNNLLTTINKNIFPDSMSRLRKLFFRWNNIKNVPYDMFNALPNVDYLSLAHNSIDALDSRTFVPMKKLKKLHMSHNNLQEISADLLESLNYLTELLVDYNKLTFLPEVNATFPSLQKFTIEGNPWQCACFDLLAKFLESRHIEYRPNSAYFKGEKPLCVVTPVKFCVRDADMIQKYGIVGLYDRLVG